MSEIKQPLISLITPCYNGETHLLPYINGLLSQTYKNVEFIFVNDGSTDKTEEIILSYQEQFEKKGWTFKYIKQSNKGASSAINQGLKIFSGDYLSWYDSDDIMMPSFFTDLVDFLEKHKDYAMVFPLVEFVTETTHKVLSIKGVKHNKDFSPLENELVWNSEETPMPTHGIARSSMFLECNPTRHIYDERKSGQNAAMLFPLFSKYKIGYLQKILSQYVVRANSDCHSPVDQDKKLLDWELNEINVVQQLDIPEYKKNFYLNCIQKRYSDTRKEKLYGRSQKVYKIYVLGIPLLTAISTENKTIIKFCGIRVGKVQKNEKSN